jgi:hypothetical protein
VRPRNNSKTPDKTNREYCIYHPAHKDYTYNDKWLNLLVSEVGDASTVVQAAPKVD